MNYVRDLIHHAAQLAGVRSLSTNIAGEELNNYLRSLQFIIDELAMEKLMQPQLEQFTVACKNNQVTFINTSTKWWTDLTEEEQAVYQDDPAYFLTDGVIMQPDSVQFHYAGTGMEEGSPSAADDSLYYEAEFIDQRKFVAAHGTIGSDFRYPKYWTWMNGEQPVLKILSKHIFTPSIRISAGFDQFHNLGPNSRCDRWPTGLQALVCKYLAAEIAKLNDYDASRLTNDARLAKIQYRKTAVPRATYTLDSNVPHGGATSRVGNGWAFLDRGWMT
jgi:hypothetical protein